MLPDKPWKLEAVLFFFAALLSCIFVGMLAGSGLRLWWPDLKPGDREFYGFILGTVSFQLLPLFFAHRFLRQHDVTWAELLGVERAPFGKPLVRALLVALLALPMALTLNTVSEMFITAVQSKPAEMQHSMKVLQITHTLGRRLVFGFAAVVMAPIMEEFIFRGILYKAIKEGGYPRLALYGSSVLFAAIHGSWMTLVPLTFLAVVLALLYERTGRLLAPILAHATFNAVNIGTYFALHGTKGAG